LDYNTLVQAGKDVPEVDEVYARWTDLCIEAVELEAGGPKALEACRAAIAYDDAIWAAAERGQRVVSDDPNLDALYSKCMNLAHEVICPEEH
jgi:hypothetical protein